MKISKTSFSEGTEIKSIAKSLRNQIKIRSYLLCGIKDTIPPPTTPTKQQQKLKRLAIFIHI